ncbi:G patch domain-containing protein 3 [Dromiciops gliroides]|uniref:G patch domain-containing protein 3 n=1 Tax=Dromiciops gliroides TaxID=33562 RepID=UPI001CC398D9|nr:G patch domain-containing protein 3 [Dromiciops gliroides]XP_043848099.1 G patch domain-containing protein 3 [Dromiciops gliroides]
MAVPTSAETAAETSAPVYLVVSGIPAGLRSAQLRNYFSQFREQRGGRDAGFLCFHYRHRPERALAPEPAPAAAALSSDPAAVPAQSPAPAPPSTCCCVISVRGPAQAERLLRMYSGRPWLDSQGNWLPGRCLIRRLRLPVQEAGVDPFPFKTRKELHRRRAGSEAFTLTDLRQLPELNPPALMPNGNVGTPMRIFLELIRACRLPPRIITQLQLHFPKTGSSRRYGNVPFEYEDSETVEQEELVYTDQGEEIPETPQGACPTPITAGSHGGPKEDKEEEEESHSDDDNDTCEEWERHEALHEDVTNQERTAERLFEQEIELKWEKGGSGLVFYTDAQYWQEEEGDFDEQTADDWDVDMSIYYDQDGGDKDARDSVQMRLEQRLRDGLEDGSVVGQVGTFERHTKGIGRKVMERQGWAEGQGLGSSCSGVAEALDNDGQNPKCKRGLGYHGEKLQSFGQPKRPRGTNLGLISTIYDEPLAQDQGDLLLRRQPPTSLKFRADMAFVRGSGTDSFFHNSSEPK